MNPHKKETRFLHELDESYYFKRTDWYDTEFWAETRGIAIVLCTINCSMVNSANVGFRLVDENNEPLLPYRTSTNTRNSAYFSAELTYGAVENLSPISFHMIVNCKYVKLQILVQDVASANAPGAIIINRAGGVNIPSPTDAVWNHKTISTMTAIPLLRD